MLINSNEIACMANDDSAHYLEVHVAVSQGLRKSVDFFYF